jgi:hypothetical protein
VTAKNPREPKAVRKLIADAQRRRTDPAAIAFLKKIGLYVGRDKGIDVKPSSNGGGTRRKPR